MAMIDYGALVKKNGKLLPCEDLFNNYSTLQGGELREEYEYISIDGEPERTLVKHEYVGDESERTGVGSVIHNYMAVVGDKDYLIATYKNYLSVFDSKEMIGTFPAMQYLDFDYGHYLRHKMVQKIAMPFGEIKIKALERSSCAIASFWYKEDYYEILFGYGVDWPAFLFSKNARIYFYKKTLSKIQRWIRKNK